MLKTKSEILKSLNEDQKKPVMDYQGPSFILAGPGSGKTFTITSRAAYMIEEGVNPENILLFTFTRKAAEEIKERVSKMIGKKAELMTVGTYHSVCARILRRYAHYLGYENNFSIYDEEDKNNLLKSIVVDDRIKPHTVANYISHWKSKMISPQRALEIAENTYEHLSASYYQEYQRKMKEENALDFDDLIYQTVLLLRNHHDVYEKITSRYQYIIADEFHDSSVLDIELIKLLGGEKQNVCMILDDEQCLLPGTMIKTSDGDIPVEKVTKSTELIVASGHGETYKAYPEKISSKKYKGKIIKITTESGNVLQGTPEHCVFARQNPVFDKQYVYLMYEKELGYRIGRGLNAKYGNVKNEHEAGPIPKKFDALWILKVCDIAEEAIYWESYFSHKYGIPRYGLHSANEDKDAVSHKLIEDNVKKLAKDEFLFLEHPHYRLSGTTGSDKSHKEKLVLDLVMFGKSETEASNKDNYYLHKHALLCSNAKNSEFANMTKKHVDEGWFKKNNEHCTFSKGSIDYDALYKNAHSIINEMPDSEIRYKAILTENKDEFDFTPLSHVRVGMTVPVEKEGKIVEERVVDVEFLDYVGPVYDIDVKLYRNYIAEGIVVHNSIYSFRGSDIEAVLNARNHFDGLKEFVLRQNYRSTSTIVEASRSLISHNRVQIKKEIFTENEKGEQIVYFECNNPEEESIKVVKIIMGLLRTKEFDKKDIAILYRMSYLSRAIEEALLKNGIPYEIVGGLPFYSRKEIKDIMSYIRLIFNPFDSQAFERAINVPKRGIGPKSIEKIYSFAKSSNNVKMNLVEACKHVELKGKAKQGINQFNEIINTLQEAYEQESSPGELVKLVIELSNYKAHLMEHEDEPEERIANIDELQLIASQYETLDDFINSMSLNAIVDREDDENSDRVQLLTMHSSKGLEYKAVIIIGANDGTVPHWKAETLKEIEEERRLFYVAMTRAKKMLFITRPKWVNFNGSVIRTKESRFIDEIDSEYILKTK